MSQYRLLKMIVVLFFCCACGSGQQEAEKTKTSSVPSVVATAIPSIKPENTYSIETSATAEEEKKKSETNKMATNVEAPNTEKSTEPQNTKETPQLSASITPKVEPAPKETIPKETIPKESTPATVPSENVTTVQPSMTKPSVDEQKESTVTFAIYNEDQSILGPTEIAIGEKDSVFDVLKKTAKAHQIPIDFNGNGATAYVMGINNVYEFDDGPESGWVYRVNGVYGSRSSGMAKVSSGDVIEWVYLKNASKQNASY